MIFFILFFKLLIVNKNIMFVQKAEKIIQNFTQVVPIAFKNNKIHSHFYLYSFEVRILIKIS